MRFIPAKDKLLVKPLDPLKKGSIVLPDSIIREQRKGEVVSVGTTGISISDGRVIEHPSFFNVGDTVVYQNLDQQDIEIDGEKYQIIPLIAVLGTLKEAVN